ncbi:MAG TPA: prepilin-type N-terminal cleavage/methylation domain-containing protein [Azospirillaceae bacterium]|nr:prepilin-type N-terminal cleavage/methylation domain-containing protein [Azospirillaceae bacterium]
MRRCAESGFTLIETLAALAILTAVLATAYRILGEGALGAGSAERRAGALAIAEAQLAAIAAEPLLQSGRFPGEGDGYRWEIAVEPRRDPPFAEVGRVGMAAWRVAVTVRWEGNRSLTLATTRLTSGTVR